MEQSGEAPEPEQPAAQPTSPLPPPEAATAPDDPGPRDGRGFVIGAILALVVVIGAVAWLARPDDGLEAVGRTEERFPTPTTLPPPTTVPASTTPAVSAPVPTTAVALVTPPPAPATTEASATTTPATPATTVPATPPPGSTLPGSTLPGGPADTSVPPPEDPDYVATLVPSVAAFTEPLSTPQLAMAQITEMLTSGRHDVAAPGPAASICAAIPMDRPLAVRGRWERNGRRVASTDLERRDTPGFGECLTNDDDVLDEGSYQYIASDSNGNESAAGGLVIGAARVEQPLRNDGASAICSVRIAPSASRYFEVYVYTAAPIAPGAQVTVPVAAVDQDVETVGCDDEELASFSFLPASGTIQSLAP